jgi:hypothetical protein
LLPLVTNHLMHPIVACTRPSHLPSSSKRL